MYIEKLLKDKKIVKEILLDVFKILNATENEIEYFSKNGKLTVEEDCISFKYKTFYDEQEISIFDFHIYTSCGHYDIGEKLDKFWYHFMSKHFGDYQENYYNHAKKMIDQEYEEKIKKLEQKIQFLKEDQDIGKN